nr:ABC transporter permease subunit [Glycomyces amatae]
MFKAELRRLARRRLSLVFGILAVAGVVGLTAIMWATSSQGPDEGQLAEAQAQADQWNEDNPDYGDCLEDEGFFEENANYAWAVEDSAYADMSHEERCEFYVGGMTAEDFIYTYTFSFENEGSYMLIGVAIVAGLIMMMLASSAIGAEWSSGGMSNLMVWHPHRMKVWGAKLGAALAVCAAAVAGVVVLAFGLLYLTAAVRGEVGDLDGVWWEATLERLGRTGLLTLGMTALGASLAMLGRHTAIAGGVIAGYLIIGDMLVQITSMSLPVDYPERFSLYTWVMAWISGKIELYNWNSSGMEMTPDVMVITATDAGLLLGGIVVLFGALATWAFQRRDAA